MTEANLRPSWLSSCNIYCLHKSAEVCTQFQEKKQLYILLCLVQSTSVTVQWGMYTIWWKASCTLISVAKEAWYCLYLLQSSMGYGCNSRQKKLCTLVAWYGLQTLSQTSERMLNPAFIDYGVQQGLYTILGKSSYTLIRFTKHAFVILCTIPGKTGYTLT